MSSIIATITGIILSVLSFKGISCARATAGITSRSTGIISTRSAPSSFFHALKFSALPFVLLLTLFAAAPQPAHAEPFASGEGTFDCLGDLDWGCQVMGYLFENKSITTFHTDGTADSSTGTNDSTSVQNALKFTMGFFSNAMLIIASLILLYHLIVMVAETAHTGTIGGKETNQLWAPIRLVIAIGLLVPLSDGYNSGQYIIIQVAKWGSGLGSQTWKLFTEKMAEKQTLVPSISPAVQTLISDTLKIYACQAAVNYFADKSNTPADKIIDSDFVALPPPSDVQVLNVGVCGSLQYHMPTDTKYAGVLTIANSNAFRDYRKTLQDAAKKIFDDYFSPEKRSTSPLPYRGVLNKYVLDFQNKVIDGMNGQSPNVAQSMYDDITSNIKKAANEYGWMSAGTWFMALTRAQGQIVTAGITIPEATPPDMQELSTQKRAAGQTYGDFLLWAMDKLNPGIGSAPVDVGDGKSMLYPIPNVIINKIKSAGSTINEQFSSDFGSYIEELAGFLQKSPRDAAEFFLKFVDETAAHYGVWQSNGDYDSVNNKLITIPNANPLAALADLGHRKVQMAVDLWGMALKYAAAGVSGDLAFRILNPRNTLLVAFDTSWAGSLMGTVGLTLAFFTAFIATGAMMAGVVLAFVIPLMPFVRFFYAIVTWAATVIEAMICLPLLALAHLSPKGEGFSGQKPLFGYRMIFQIFLRPALVIFGLIASLLIFGLAVRFLNAMYFDTVLGIGEFKNGAGFIARIVFNVFYVALIYISGTMSFKMIDHIPRRALQWMGDGVQEEHYEDQEGTLRAVSSEVSTQIHNDFLQGPERLGGRLRLR